MRRVIGIVLILGSVVATVLLRLAGVPLIEEHDAQNFDLNAATNVAVVRVTVNWLVLGPIGLVFLVGLLCGVLPPRARRS